MIVIPSICLKNFWRLYYSCSIFIKILWTILLFMKTQTSLFQPTRSRTLIWTQFPRGPQRQLQGLSAGSALNQNNKGMNLWFPAIALGVFNTSMLNVSERGLTKNAKILKTGRKSMVMLVLNVSYVDKISSIIWPRKLNALRKRFYFITVKEINYWQALW